MKTHIQIFLLLILVSTKALALKSGAWQQARYQAVSYFIYIPKTKDAKSMMVSLHGCTQRAKDLAELGNWEKTAEEHSMVVVLPDVPNGGVMMGCWDYYGKNHDASQRHHSAVISLTETLLQDQNLNIDSDQVYVSGLSSGSAEAMLLGCMRPDLFAGMSMNSGPAIGTGKGDLFLPSTTAKEVADYCESLAGSYQKNLETQTAAVVAGDQDFIVNPEHSVLTVQALQEVYKAKDSKPFDLSQLQGSNTQGKGLVFLDEDGTSRISFIVNHGLGHAWPSGKGQGRVERYVNPQSIDYPAYLAQFFTNNNKRVGR